MATRSGYNAKVIELLAQITYKILRLLGKTGGTWPGEIALSLDPVFLKRKLESLSEGFVFITGTNGKTTTTHLLVEILRVSGQSVVTNKSGANLPNGLASAFIAAKAENRTPKLGIFEVDENFLSELLNQVTPRMIVITNLFRDQLDRYGEIESIKNKWLKALTDKRVQIVLNSDDPAVATVGLLGGNESSYFSVIPSLPRNLDPSTPPFDKLRTTVGMTHRSGSPKDSGFCPRCGEKLQYYLISFSHVGDWLCPNCGLQRPEPQEIGGKYKLQLPGLYNQYNAAAAILSATILGVEREMAVTVTENFVGVFGRGEIIEFKGTKFELHLAKNPAGFTESLLGVSSTLSPVMILSLNDNIADGRDVSWIWDIGLEGMNLSPQHLLVTGTRAADLALRLVYSGLERERIYVNEKMSEVVNKALELSENSPVPIIATYTAMLEARKFLLGRNLL